MKIKYFLLPIVAIFVLMLVDCFSPWQGDAGVVSISFDSRGRALDLDEETLAKLEYTVTFTGPGGEFSREFIGSQTLKETLAPGKWDITVIATDKWFEEGEYDELLETYMQVPCNERFAIGYATVNVIAGRTIPVTVYMGFAGAITFHIEFDINDFPDYLHDHIRWQIDKTQSEGDEDPLASGLYPGSYTIYLEKGGWDLRVALLINGSVYGLKDFTDIEIEPGDHIFYDVDFEYDEGDNDNVYLISLSDMENGTVDVKGYTMEGDAVYVTPMPSFFYEFYDWIVNGINKDDIEEVGFNTYMFTMPANEVKIGAIFREREDLINYTNISINIEDIHNLYEDTIYDFYYDLIEYDDNLGWISVFFEWDASDWESGEDVELVDGQTYTVNIILFAFGKYYFDYDNENFAVAIDSVSQNQNINIDNPQYFSFTATFIYTEAEGLELLQP